MRLGWRNARPNDFQSPDQRPLRDQFGDLQRFMTWPHVFVRDATLVVGAGAGAFANWDQEIDDPYSLHTGTSQNVMVPTDFDTWMLVGQAAAIMSTSGGSGRRAVSWFVNTVLTEFQQSDTFAVVPDSFSVGIVQQVKSGDTVQVQLFNGSAGGDEWAVRAHMFFLPMA